MDALFQVHRLNDEGMKKAEMIASAFDRLLTELKPLCAEGREFAIVKTKLEEAAFFAKKAMSTVAKHQDVTAARV